MGNEASKLQRAGSGQVPAINAKVSFSLLLKNLARVSGYTFFDDCMRTLMLRPKQLPLQLLVVPPAYTLYLDVAKLY
jgi:hypothetical protein